MLNSDCMKRRSQADNPIHIDKIYNIMYPDKEANAVYCDDPNRVNRRENMQRSRYDMMVKVNGPLHVKLLNQSSQDNS